MGDTFAMMNPNMDYAEIREDTLESIKNYVEHGWQPGGFLTAVLANDLQEAVGRADHGNLIALPAICSYVYNEIPANCHGSYDIVEQWIARHRSQP